MREYSKTDEDAVRSFVAAHAAVLSGLSRTEALKWLERRVGRAGESSPPDGPGARRSRVTS